MDHEIYQSIYFKISKRIVQFSFVLIFIDFIILVLLQFEYQGSRSDQAGTLLDNDLVLFIIWSSLFAAAWLAIFMGHWIYWHKFLRIVIRDYGSVPDLMSFPHLAVAVMSFFMMAGGLLMVVVFTYGMILAGMWEFS